MNQYNMEKSSPETLFHTENPLIGLYMVKKSIQSQLIQQIHLNSYLQNIFNPELPYKCKSQLTLSSQQNQSSTSFKSPSHGSTQKRKNPINKTKNDTKNIPKNFGKAIITFVQQNEWLVRKALANEGVTYEAFVAALRCKKRGINSIADLRSLWLDGQFPYSRQTRIISQYFLKRGSLGYIFSSRITNHEGHIKYRGRLIDVLRHPQDFTSIKTS